MSACGCVGGFVKATLLRSVCVDFLFLCVFLLIHTMMKTSTMALFNLWGEMTELRGGAGWDWTGEMGCVPLSPCDVHLQTPADANRKVKTG